MIMHTLSEHLASRVRQGIAGLVGKTILQARPMKTENVLAVQAPWGPLGLHTTTRLLLAQRVSLLVRTDSPAFLWRKFDMCKTRLKSAID